MNDETIEETDLGMPGDYAEWPASISIEGAPFWLVRGADGEYRLLSALCPHAGGEVRIYENMFLCPLHYWTFSQSDGTCLNDADERLMRRRVVQRADGRLYAIGAIY